MDEFESYIKNNREGLDVEKPDADYLWAGISKSLNQPKKKRFIAYFRYAAAAVVLIVVTSTITRVWYLNSSKPLMFENIDPVLARQEVELLAKINDYSSQIKLTQISTQNLASGSNEIQYIDDLISYYSADLKKNGPNPKLLNSLMDLYHKKILILERMLNEIEKKKNHEKRIAL